MTEQLVDRWRGALLGTALGDAVGAPFEGWPAVEAEDLDVWLRSSAAPVWTDDTAMTIGLAESLIDCGGQVDPQHLGDTFAAAFHDEPWRGYGPGPPQVFAAARRGTPYVEAAAAMFGGTGSFGNGAAMRAAPAAIVGMPDLDRVAALARAQARVTHAHSLGQDGAALLVMAVGIAATRATSTLATSLREVRDRLVTPEMTDAVATVLDLDGLTDPAVVVSRVGNSITAVEAVPAAIACFLGAPDDPVEVLRTAVRLGGDTDTIAAMAGALAGAHVGASALPGHLLDRLEARVRLTALADLLGRVAGS